MGTMNTCNKTNNILKALGENYFRAKLKIILLYLALVKWVQVKMNTRKISKAITNSNVRKWGGVVLMNEY